MRAPWILLILLFGAAELQATAMTWGTVEEWRQRCEIAERWAHVDVVEGDKRQFSRAEIEDAVGCAVFLEGYRLGTLMAVVGPLLERYGEEVPDEQLDALETVHCVEEPYDEVIPKLNAYLRRQDPEREFGNVIFEFFRSTYPCEQAKSDQ